MKINHATLRLFIVLAAIVCFGRISIGAAPSAPTESQLLETLRSGKPADKAIACKQLAIHGTKSAAPELGKLLTDEQLASWARIALEAIPDRAADEALENSLDGLRGKLLVGAINSLGVRRDSGAVERLVKRLQDSDFDVASAAAVALGRIGDEKCRAALRPALATAPVEVRSAVAEGCILAAERLLAAGNTNDAATLYDDVRRAEVPKQLIREATRGVIIASGAQGVPLLVELLQSRDKRSFQLALKIAREIPGAAVSDALAGQLVKATPERAPLLLAALGDRVGEPMPSAVLEFAKSGEPRARAAAIEVIGRLGDVGSVPTLLALASDNDATLSQAARAALASLPGDKLNQEIAARIKNADGAELATLLWLVEQRRIAAVEDVLARVNHGDEKVRRAALGALGATAGPTEIPQLLVLAIQPKRADDSDAAIKSLKAACVRMKDREATAALLAGACFAPAMQTPAQQSLLEILGAMGGPRALEAVGAAAKSDNVELQDTGSKLLGAWMTPDAAPVLLEIAKDETKTHHGRALRGYLRITRQFHLEDRERAAMCRQALGAAKRPEDRLAILQILERHPCVDSLAVAVLAAESADSRDDAQRTATTIFQKLDNPPAEARELAKRVGLDLVKVEIVQAEYGAGDARKDVTEALRRHVRDLRVILLPAATYNESFGGDPAPGVVKQLTVRYRIDGKAGEAKFPENAQLNLPTPK